MLQESNEENDLPLGGIGKGVPLFWWGTRVIGERSSIDSHWPRPVDAIGLNNVSNKSSHGDASVLDFGMTQEADGSSLVAAPDGCVGQLQGVIVLFFGQDNGRFGDMNR